MRKRVILIRTICIFICVLFFSTFLLKGHNASAYSIVKEDKYNLMDWFSDVINNKAYSNKVMINDKCYGYISKDYSINDIGKELANIYIAQLGIDKSEISSIDIKLNIKLTNESIKQTEISDTKTIAKKIFENKNENNLNIEIKAIQEVNEAIESKTEHLKTNQLYMGEIKSVQGLDGLKNVTKLVTYTLDSSPEEIVLDEEVVEASTSNIVYEGQKNPYIDGIAFLKMPLENKVITSYYGSRWNTIHKGIDFAGNFGDRVSAAINGEVIYAQFNDGGYGNLVILKHDNNMESYYAHMNSVNVKVGDIVQKGDKLGEVGSTGQSTGPHLHFELRVNDEPVDPLNYIY